MEARKAPVLVTGFGPFHQHKVNASWVAVQEMKKLGIKHGNEDVSLEIREIPVVYEVVSKTVPKLWEELRPRLCVHVGVSPYDQVRLERIGKNLTYVHPDVSGKTPPNGACVDGGPECIRCVFDDEVERICEVVTEKTTSQCGERVTVTESRDAGRYLCDFIYYTSLRLGSGPSVFVHVPPLGSPYSREQLAVALKNIIEALLCQLDK